MLTIVLSVSSFLVLAAQFWLGVAVIGWQGDDMLLYRSKSPGPYWFVMVLEVIIGVGLPVLAYFSGV